MTRQVINRGSSAGDNTGEGIYYAHGKANDNFAELYAEIVTVNIRAAPYNATGNGSTDDWNAISLAAAAAGANGYVLVPAGTYRINQNATLPYGPTFLFRGGIFDVNPANTLTVNSALPQEHVQIFTATSPIVFSDSDTTEAYVGWWGGSCNASAAVNKAAILASINCHNRSTTVWLPRGRMSTDGGIDFTKSGVLLSGAADSAAWAGYQQGGSVVDFTSGTYGFSLLGTQVAPGPGGIVTDGSGLMNMTIQSQTPYAIATGVKIVGPKKLKNLQVRSFATFGIDGQEYVIEPDIDNVQVFDIGPLVAQSGTGIRITGAHTTAFLLRRLWVSNCYRSLEIKAGLDFKVERSTLELSTAEGLLLTSTVGQSLGSGTFEDVWCENNGAGAYAIKLDTSAVQDIDHMAGMRFIACRVGPQAGQKPIYVGAGIQTATSFERCRLGGSTTDLSLFLSPTTLVDPVGTFFIDTVNSPQYNIIQSSASASLVYNPTGNQVSSAGSLPASIAFPDTKTITLTFKAGAVGLLLFSDLGSGGTTLISLGPTVNARLIDDGTGGAVVISSTPAAGKFGVWKPTSSTLSIKNAVGAARTITLQTIGAEVLQLSDPV